MEKATKNLARAAKRAKAHKDTHAGYEELQAVGDLTANVIIAIGTAQGSLNQDVLPNRLATILKGEHAFVEWGDKRCAPMLARDYVTREGDTCLVQTIWAV